MIPGDVDVMTGKHFRCRNLWVKQSGLCKVGEIVIVERVATFENFQWNPTVFVRHDDGTESSGSVSYFLVAFKLAEVDDGIDEIMIESVDQQHIAAVTDDAP